VIAQHVAIVGLSPDAIRLVDLQLAAAAVLVQLTRDVARVWPIAPSTIAVVASLDEVPEGALAVAVLPDPDLAGKLGYHRVGPDGRAYARVFTRDRTRDEITVLLSHEIIEATIDPLVNLWAGDLDDTLFAVEVCDPVQRDSYDLELGERAVRVSNFVTPAWFNPHRAAFDGLDHLNLCAAPFEVREGGYVVKRSLIAPAPFLSVAGLDADELHPASRTARRLRIA